MSYEDKLDENHRLKTAIDALTEDHTTRHYMWSPHKPKVSQVDHHRNRAALQAVVSKHGGKLLKFMMGNDTNLGTEHEIRIKGLARTHKAVAAHLDSTGTHASREVK